MRAILVDPADKSVKEVDVDGKLASLQRAVDGHIEGIYPDRFHQDFRGVHGYVDEERLLGRKDPTKPWSVPGYRFLVGPGIFLCSTRGGDEAPCSMSLGLMRHHVIWLW